jgi:hypothetical protein
MPRLIPIAASAAMVAICATPTLADDPSTAPSAYLSWPGKSDSSAQTQPSNPGPAKAVVLPRQFFGGPAGDIAAPPGLLPPHAVPGSAAVTNPSTQNTPDNRARADMMTPVGDDVVIQ